MSKKRSRHKITKREGFVESFFPETICVQLVALPEMQTP